LHGDFIGLWIFKNYRFQLSLVRPPRLCLNPKAATWKNIEYLTENRSKNQKTVKCECKTVFKLK